MSVLPTAAENGASASVSRSVDLDGPVHYVDHGGPLSGPLVVGIHGLGGSHANWHLLGPLLAAAGCRVLALDLVGFGRTPRLGRSSSVQANCEMLGRFLDEVVGEPAVLLGNSMGGTIAMLQAAAAPERVSGMVLVGPASPRGRELPNSQLARTVALCAVPGLAERALVRRRNKLGPERLVEETFALTTADASLVSDEVRRLAVELATVRANGPDGEAAFLEAARSLVRMLCRPGRFREMVRSVPVPALVVQGELDRLVPASAVRALVAQREDWRLELLPGVGHVPQVEAPERMSALILEWLASRSLLVEPA